MFWLAVWMTQDEAAAFIGRTARTLRVWRRNGWVRTGRRGGKVVYERESLRVAKLVARKRQYEAVGKPGPGRGRRNCDPAVDPVLF